MTKKFVDDVIEHRESDIEKIQTKPNMYISYLGSKGSLHMTKELINNAIDECINNLSPGDTIDIALDEAINTIMVSDNGRGIPKESMKIVCTTLQSGSKFERTGGISTAGENGVGLTACNALSSLFEIIVDRYGERARITFHEGIQQGEITTSKCDPNTHGTTFIMKPSEYYMGKKPIIVTEDLMDWVEKISYLLPPEIVINFKVNRKGKEAVINKKLKNKHGLYDFVKKNISKGSMDPVHFNEKLELKEEYRGKTYDRFVGLELSFSYSPESEDSTIWSFCNFVSTIDHGVHVDAVKTAMSQYFIKQARELISDRDMKKIEAFKGEDVMQGLTLAMALFTNYQPQFSGQTKEKLASQELQRPVMTLTTRALDNYFKLNPKDLKKIVDRIKATALARVQSTKLRKSVIKGEVTNFDEHLIKNFEPANNTGKNQYREIFFIEGDSAKGSAVTGRFSNDTQALFALKGVPINAYGVDLAKVLHNKELNNLVKVLGCNIGDRFDITKLKYDKLIMLTDSDIDGYNITSLLCTFFLYHMPEIIKAGKLYKAVAPLYKIKSKHKQFILDKKEFFKIFEKHIAESIKLTLPKSDKAYTHKDLADLLEVNQNYLKMLEKLSKQFGVNALLLEFILAHRNDADYKKKLKKVYPEIEMDGNIISGIVDNKYQVLVMDEMFDQRASRLEELIKLNQGAGVFYVDVYEKDSKGIYHNNGTYSIGGFLMLAQKYEPPIIARFKGLGELNPSDLCATTLDPNFRLIKQLTMEEVEKELEKFDVLHGSSAEARQKLMDGFSLDPEDFDN